MQANLDAGQKLRRLQRIDSLVTSPASKPNFFILGAGRCGTTTLYRALRQHPQIFMPRVKEPSFFCSYFQVVQDPVKYFQLFGPGRDRPAIGEASHAYFSNPESAEVIHALFPAARFILIFRSPTERAYSLYHWARHAQLEPLATFEQALAAEDQRYADPEFLWNCPQYFWNFMYVRSSYYHQQWQRYLDVYPREQFFALSMSELKSDPQLWIQRIFEFLQVDSKFCPTIEHFNARSYPPMSAETQRQLDDHFRQVVSATNALACRDLKIG